MKNTVSVDLKKEEDFYSLRLDMLTSSACKAILPMNVIKGKNFMRGIYDTSGYCRLADLHQIDAASVLTIVERVLELLDQCREYLIFSDEIVLTPETLYVSEGFHTVRLTYIPEKQNHSEKTKLGISAFPLRKTNDRKWKNVSGDSQPVIELRESENRESDQFFRRTKTGNTAVRDTIEYLKQELS